MPVVRYFAAAAEAAGTPHESREADTLGDLLAQLKDDHGAGFARVLDRCTVLVDGQASDDVTTVVATCATIDVLPPFAGG